jgi:hypothetical protein
VPDKLAHFLARIGIPKPDSSTIICGDQLPAVGAESQAVSRADEAGENTRLRDRLVLGSNLSTGNVPGNG